MQVGDRLPEAQQLEVELDIDLADGELRLRMAVVPAMYTTDPYVVLQDCLCYFMERMN